MTDSKEVAKWSDRSMFTAEKSDRDKGVTATLVACDPDPLGVIAIGGIAYTGRTVRDTAEVTDAERRFFLGEIAKTALKAPLEYVRFLFVIDDIHRGITHQMVRQRTAVYVQESQRFAVKEDMREAVALPTSIRNTKSLEELVANDHMLRSTLGLQVISGEEALAVHKKKVRDETVQNGGPQAHRIKWDEAVAALGDAYLGFVNDGMPAEDARGILPTNILTKIQYSTNLRAFYDTMAMRVSDQAQFEWRELITSMVKAMYTFGRNNTYTTVLTQEDLDNGVEILVSPTDEGAVRAANPKYDRVGDRVERSSLWQFEELAAQIKPLDFVLGKRSFGAAFDRASRIGERVDAFSAMGIPSSEWTKGSPEHSIPRIDPSEWLLDPESARLQEGLEFDIFGNRVPAGTGWHWSPDHGGVLYCDTPAHGGYPAQRQWGHMNGGAPSANVQDVLPKKDEENE